ncbi:MAG: Asp-tRNA(Asn)/Glu-tRNA(Gln) amidotransferase subunit GatC [Paracoccus sp. (in: a-proteobacteria)]|nr:Asp-tRNA(Asn)/Glu-tRNA(Gln) amidotransferase subunit GatC [Paracoccus sp. (in: a-proteobacteria)]
MSITEDEARKVAHLARIAVDEAALPALARELNGSLHFMDQLNEGDVEGVAPLSGVTPLRLTRREDVVTAGRMADKIRSIAPDAREGVFAVPKVVE